ncbi:type III effector, partial [Xanthomonas euvesicatoria]
MKIEKNALTESASTASRGLEEEHEAKPGASSEKRSERDAPTRSGVLDGLQKAPVRVASSSSRSRTAGHASAAGADGTLQKQADLYAEKKRVKWINATGVASRVSH